MNRQTSVKEPDSHDSIDRPGQAASSGPFAGLPRLSRRQVALEKWLRRWAHGGELPPALDWLRNDVGVAIEIDRPEVIWRASGLGRSSLVAHLTAPRLATRLAMGIENPLAHVVVDRLLGFDRTFAESRLQLTPVEWGVWTFLFLRALATVDDGKREDSHEKMADAGESAPREFALDRVGPDPFDPTDLGSIVTILWPVRIGPVAASVRLWLPESLVSRWLTAPSVPDSRSSEPAERLQGPIPTTRPAGDERHGRLGSSWHAVAGLVTMSQGLRRLRSGSVLPLINSRLRGTPSHPSGDLDLILDLDDQSRRFRIPASPVADTGGRIVRVEAVPLREPRPYDPIGVSESETKLMTQPHASSSASAASPSAPALDVPVTLTVELGRVNMTLTQLADLKPGDVIELNRHSRAPVELTSNGRVVARGELILIDTDLGVRVTSVFL